MKTIRSKILEYFEPNLLKELYDVCNSTLVSDNNLKVDTMINILNKYNKNYVELGPGTNRLAILIDNTVFKIALDRWGIQDNLNEFTMSQELQPYVTKTYETNGIMVACEYVTVISYEEFVEREADMHKILGILADSYLLGDVGTIKKNFRNWGYRDNGDLVILDFAYIYRVQGDEMVCPKCSEVLQYDDKFYNLSCPLCGRKYTFIDIRRKIPMEVEKKANFMAKELSYKLTEPVQRFSETQNKDDEEYEEEEKMSKNYYEDEEKVDTETQEEAYLRSLEEMKAYRKKVVHPVSEKGQQIAPIKTDTAKIINDSIPAQLRDISHTLESAIITDTAKVTETKVITTVKQDIIQDNTLVSSKDIVNENVILSEVETKDIQDAIKELEEDIKNNGNTSEDLIQQTDTLTPGPVVIEEIEEETNIVSVSVGSSIDDDDEEGIDIDELRATLQQDAEDESSADEEDDTTDEDEYDDYYDKADEDNENYNSLRRKRGDD